MLFGNVGLQSRLARVFVIPVRNATKRASGGKSANNNTAGRRLGPKKGEGEFVEAGQIIWRQRGTKWYPGENAGIGRDHTIYAREPGYVRYYRDPFHAKRRFIGISLGHDDRLPTPHFEPRRRRFGYTAIDNTEVAAFETAYLTRKETKRAIALKEVTQARDERRAARLASYAEVLKSAGISDVSEAQLERLELIYQYMSGGMAYGEARSTVDSLAREDIDIEFRTRASSDSDSASERQKRLDAYSNAAQITDKAVAFGANRRLAPLAAVSDDAKSKAIAEIAALAQPYLDSRDGTPAEVAAQITALLTNTPALSPADAARLKLQYLRRPTPVEMSGLKPEEREALEKRAKKGEGKIQKVWGPRGDTDGVKQYFVPTGAKLIFA